MLRGLRGNGQDLDPSRGMETMPATLRHDQQLSFLQPGRDFACADRQGEFGFPLDDENDFVSVRMTLPFAVTGIMTDEDAAVAIAGEFGESARELGIGGFRASAGDEAQICESFCQRDWH